MKQNKEAVRQAIRKNYANVAVKGASGGCCCSSGCCGGDTKVNVSEASERIGYSNDEVLEVPIDSNMGLGCGNPIAIASLTAGETVLDLGSGGGFDCFLASKQVGDTGMVIGVDMTPEMISLARNNAQNGGYTNVDFRLGEIEHLPVADQSIDVIISNCVINLSVDKEQVFKEAYRVLKTTGRLKTSDIVATTRLPENIRKDFELIASCIGGAEYIEDLKQMMNQAGFSEIRFTPKANSREIIQSWFPEKNIEDYVTSFDIEAIK